MAKRVWTNYFTTLANAQEQIFDFATLIDDAKIRHVKTVFVGLSTSGVAVTLYTSGQEYSKIDATRFAAGDPVLRAEFDAQAGVLIRIGIQDIAGAAHANVPVVIGYEVDS